jgi:hypothetical protein
VAKKKKFEVKQRKRRTQEPVPASGMPVCIAALFCEQVVIGGDQRLTLVNTLDTINLPPSIHNPGEAIEIAGARLVILLKRADAVGVHELEVSYVSESGDVDPVGLLQPSFPSNDPPETGYNYYAPIRMFWRGSGLYWLQIRHGKKLLAKSALRLRMAPDPLSGKIPG